MRRARRLRGEPGRRFHVVREVALPVMTDALDRSLLLAAAMDSRGYGRVAARGRSTVAVTAALLLGGHRGHRHRLLRTARQHRPALPRAADAPRRGRDRLGRGDAQRPARRAEPLPPRPVVDRGVGRVDRRLRGGVGDGGGERRRSHDPPPVAPAAALAGAARRCRPPRCCSACSRRGSPRPSACRRSARSLVVAAVPRSTPRDPLRPRHHHLRRRARAGAARPRLRRARGRALPRGRSDRIREDDAARRHQRARARTSPADTWPAASSSTVETRATTRRATSPTSWAWSGRTRWPAS